MFTHRFDKDMFMITYNFNNIVKVKMDLLVIDPYVSEGNVVLASLLDAPAKLDKIKTDYKKGILSYTRVEDEEERNFLGNSKYDTNCYNIDFTGITYSMNKRKVGNLAHMIINQKNSAPYIYRFNENDSLVELVMNKLINIYFIPCKTDLVQEVLMTKPEILRELRIFTNNDSLKNIEVYKFDKDLFIKTLNDISIKKGETPDPLLQSFVGDFTGYINYFKPDILENLNSKIEEFYDEDNVPEYVTQFPYPLPNKDMRRVLNRLSEQLYKVELHELNYEQQLMVYETYKKMDMQNLIKRTETFCPSWSRQYNVWAAGIEILKSEKTLYYSLTMGAGKTITSLKVNKFTCKETLKRENHITFILCPQSTITQWQGEIDLIEKGIGNSKEDYDVVIIDKTKVLMDFYKKHCTTKHGVIRFNKKTIKKPTYILCGKEAFKLDQIMRPAFNIKFDKKFEPILTCPNCGKPLKNYRKSKYGQITEIALKLKDFFNSNDKKTRKSTNIICETCGKEISDYEDFLREQEELKNSNPNYEKIYYHKHFIPNDKNLWSSEYNSVNTVRDKIFSKLEPAKPNTKYTCAMNYDEMKKNLEVRRELRKNIAEKFNLRRNVEKSNSKKISVIEFIRKRRFKFDSVIIDEAHEGNNGKSLIGAGQRALFKFSDKVILLSGTANNGYASSLHNLLMAAMPQKLIEDGTFEKIDFIRKYGILQGTIKVDEKGKVSGKADLPSSAFKEVEGINPVVFTKFLAKNFIMVNTLQELDLPMPELVEKYVPIETDPEVLLSYNNFVAEVSAVNTYMAKMLRASVFKNFINNPFSWNEVLINDGMGDKVPVQPVNVNRNSLPYLSKDYEVLEIILKEKSEGRKCFLFTDFVEGGKYIMEEEVEGATKEIKVTINSRLCRLFKENGIKYMTLESGTTSVSNRKNYIEQRKDDYDVFICQPQLVNVGLNLVFCPTYIVYTPFYKYDIISQATRRGYRANSTEENRIYHMYYRDTCEEDIINRYQRKLAEAKAIEGDFFVNIEQDKDLRTLSKMSNSIVKN